MGSLRPAILSDFLLVWYFLRCFTPFYVTLVFAYNCRGNLFLFLLKKTVFLCMSFIKLTHHPALGFTTAKYVLFIFLHIEPIFKIEF